MKFTEVTVRTTSEGSEVVADVLWRYSAYGVAISDVKDIIALQTSSAVYWDYMDENITSSAPQDVLVKAFIKEDETPSVLPQIISQLEEARANGSGYINFGSLEVTRRIVDGDDWIEIWKKHFRPFRVGPKVVVCPEWIEYTPEAGDVVVKLDNNMAFGTGEHETTSMCLELLQQYLTADSVCIDVGCGSGILGIAAVKLGARRAYLVDVDPVAVESAAHNAKINGAEDKITVDRGDLLNGSAVRGDIILANITAEILCGLAPSIPESLAKGGVLILSGIIKSRLDMVISAFTARNLKLKQKVCKGEWFALAFER